MSEQTVVTAPKAALHNEIMPTIESGQNVAHEDASATTVGAPTSSYGAEIEAAALEEAQGEETERDLGMD